jgi:hypothetical protein
MRWPTLGRTMPLIEIMEKIAVVNTAITAKPLSRVARLPKTAGTQKRHVDASFL